MTVCVAPVRGAGNADAHAHKSHLYQSRGYMTKTAPTLSSLRAKGGPLHDCMHVTFRSAVSMGSMGRMIDGQKKKGGSVSLSLF